MIFRTLILLATIAASTCTVDASASDVAPALSTSAPQVREGHLQCGGASLTARTQTLDVADHDRQVLSQSIVVQPPGQSAPAALAQDGRPFRQPFLRGTEVLDASATGWACVTAKDRQPYVYVMVSCTESPLRPACEGDSREWVRLYDIRGRSLNAGFPHGGARTPALMKRLGLDNYLTNGVSLNGIDE